MHGFSALVRSGVVALMALGVACNIADADAGNSEDEVEALDNTALEEIVVTAQHRSESLQSVPLSIGTISGEQLATLGAEGFSTYEARVPGLQFVEKGADNTQLSMRGVLTGVDTIDRPELSNTVGLYLDDMPIGLTAASPNLFLQDLERVEVLRGPQGTLYGAGSESGTIRLITRKPQLEDGWTGELTGEGGTIDHGDSIWGGSAVVNAPLLTGTAAMRALGFYRREGGYLDNPAVGRTNTNQHDTYGGRVAILAKPQENLSMLLAATLQNLHEPDDNYYNAYVGFPIRSPTVLEPTHAESRIVSLTVDWMLPGVKLTSISGYQKKFQLTVPESGAFAQFLGAQPGQFATMTIPTRTRYTAVSQELRLASAEENALRWVAGAFFSSANRTLEQALGAPGIEAALGLPPGPSEGTITDRIYDGWFKVNPRQYAVFVDGTWKISNAWSLSTGARWYSYQQEQHVLYTGIFNDDGTNHGVLRLNVKTSQTGLNPRANLAYHLDPDKMLYMSAARGFRLGGLNEPLSVPLCGMSQPGAFQSDHLWNYELGAKTAWLDHRVTLNTAAFYINFNDFQTQQRFACGFSVIQNAGNLRSQGVEWELTARPTGGLLFSFGGAYTESQLRNDVPTVGRDGDRAPYVPRWALNVAVDYEKPLSSRIRGFIGVDSQYVGSRITAFTLQPYVATLPSYALVNSRIGIQDGAWRLSVFCDNLMNEHPLLSQDVYPYSTVTQLRTITTRPRTVGLRATVSIN